MSDKFIFKVNKNGVIQPLDNGVKGVINCTTGAIVPWGSFYDDETYSIDPASTSPSDSPTVISPEQGCTIDGTTRGCELEKSGVDANPTIQAYTNNAPLANIPDSHYTRYGMYYNGGGGAVSNFASMRFLEISYPQTSNNELFANNVIKNYITAGHLFIRQEAVVESGMECKVFAVERINLSDSSNFNYRIWIHKDSYAAFEATNAGVGGYPIPPNANARIRLIDNSGALIESYLKDLPYTNKQYAAALGLGTSFKCFHFFADSDRANVFGTSGKIEPVEVDATHSDEPELMGIYDPGAGLPAKYIADEVAEIKAVYKEDGTVATCVAQSSASSGEYMVRSEGTISVGTLGGQSNWDAVHQKAWLTQKQSYGWMLSQHAVPASTPNPPSVSGSVNGCVVSFNCTNMGSESTITARLINPNGSQAQNNQWASIADITFSSTGTQSFATLKTSTYDNPGTNQNGSYTIKFYSGNSASGSPILTLSNQNVSTCPYVTATSTTSGCDVTVTLNNHIGITSAKLRLTKVYSATDIVRDSSNNILEVTVNSGSSWAGVFDVAGANFGCESNYDVEVIDLTSNSSNTTPMTWQNSSSRQVLGTSVDCLDNINIATTAAEIGAGCGIEASVTADPWASGSCIEYLKNQSGNKRIKAEFWTTGNGGSKQFEVIQTIPNTWSSAVTGFDWTTSSSTAFPAAGNATYTVKWYREFWRTYPSPAQNVWLHFGADDDNSVTVANCKTVNLGAVTANSCGLDIAITSTGYSTSELFAKIMKVGGSQVGTTTTFPLTTLNGTNTEAFPAGTCSGNYTVTVTNSSGSALTSTSNAVAVTCPITVTNATPTQSSCQVTGIVTDVSCLPENTSGKVRLRAKLHKNSDNSHVETITIQKDNLTAWTNATAGSNKVEFVFGASSPTLENITYKIIWEYENSSNTWVDLSQDQTITVGTCPTFSGSAAQSTSPKCGIDITVNWSQVSNLGSTIRAVVFIDTNANQALDGGESTTVGSPLNFTAGSGTETKNLNLDNVASPNGHYIVEFQADPDGDTTFTPLDNLGLATSHANKAVQITNCTVCADNSTPHYIQIDASGNIVTDNGSGTRSMKPCTGSGDVLFATDGYCKTSASQMTLYGTGSTAGFASQSAACAAGTADATAITVRLYGASSTTGQPLSPFTGSGYTTGLAAGWYLVCGGTLPATDADPCTAAHAFQIDTNGKIVSSNGQSGSSKRAAAYTGTFGSRSATHVWGAGSNLCFSGQSFTYEPVVHSSEAVARTSLGCANNDGGTLYLFGNSSGDLYVHTANNAAESNRKDGAPGWYTTCVQPASGTTVCGTERFLQITGSGGDWDGKIYDANGSQVGSAHAIADDWFDESPITGWTAKTVGVGFTGGATPTASDATQLCPGSYVNANDDASNKLYVSGTLENYRQNSDRLRIYRGAGKTQPLAAGWYRYCGTPIGPVVNGVPEYREKFNCYGNPFTWYSANAKGSMVLDDNGWLTNGIKSLSLWYKDAPIKDLTNTNNDLGIYNWNDAAGDTGKSTIQSATKGVSCSPPNNNKNVLKFTASKKRFLNRSSSKFHHPDAGSGMSTISSAGTSPTEITAAIVIDAETDGVVFRLTDIVSSNGDKIGNWDTIEDTVNPDIGNSTVTESGVEVKKAGGNIELRTGKRSAVWDSSSKTISWGSASQSTSLTAAVSGWSVVVVTTTTEGHSIRVNGAASGSGYASNAEASKFCDGNIGISNLNTTIGADCHDEQHITMDFGEFILYNEQLNRDEIEELEGYLKGNWCLTLNGAHPYNSSTPNCSKCESDCCESEVTISETASTNDVQVTASYKCSESVFGYQFKLNGFSSLGMTAGLYKSGDAIPNSNSSKKFKAEFTDPMTKGFLNYISVDSSGNVFVIGHFYDGASGDYESALQPVSVATQFVKITISNHASATSNQNFSSVSASIATSESKMNTPATPHPILATYYPYTARKQFTPVRSYNGDSTGDGSVSITDVESIITRIPLTHEGSSPYDMTVANDVAVRWIETLDANGKGWLDVCDAVTTLLNLKNNGAGGGSGTPLSTNASVVATAAPTGLLSSPSCTNKLIPTECDPCPCPKLKEPEDCTAAVWIEGVEVNKQNPMFAVVTVKYQSSCCLNGYKIELGGYDTDVVGTTGYHDGVLYVPSYGNDIGQMAAETNKNGWYHGTTLSPTYSGDVWLTSGESLMSSYQSQTQGPPQYLSPSQDTLLNFPIVWGMSTGNVTSQGLYARFQPSLSNGCIPATCDGESRVLVKFVVNTRSFKAGVPFIKNFRLVTNDDLRAPNSFGSGVTWTGDGDDADAIVGFTDWERVVEYAHAGWSRLTTWSNSAEQTANRAKVAKFDSENDNGYIDVVDVLSVGNHMLIKGPDTTDLTAKVVPNDCCPCDLPTNFTITTTVKPCNCWEEGYVAGKEGHVTLTWTQSGNATSYTIYRLDTDRGTASSAGRSGGLVSLHLDRSVTLLSGLIGASELSNPWQISQNYKELQKTSVSSVWKSITTLDGTETSWTDKNPPTFKDCCPDEELPKVVYMIVAHNDCGETTAEGSYIPKCCNVAPKANDVALANRIVNRPITFMADAVHPFAASPFGGVNKAASAVVTFTGVPANDVTLKVIDYLGTSHTFKFKEGGGSSTASLTFINTSAPGNTVTKVAEAVVSGLAAASVKITGANTAGELTMTQNDGSGNTNAEFTICGNTKITASSTAAITLPASGKFSGGNALCDESVVGFPESCERLTFTITDVAYSDVVASHGRFVGPADGGGVYPTPNNSGQWIWAPPDGYLGTVTFKYRVTNESGCFDDGKITVLYEPVKVVLECDVAGCGDSSYGDVSLSFTIPKGIVGDVRILRKLSTDATAWNTTETSPQILLDSAGEKVSFSITDINREESFQWVDTTAPVPDACCDSDKTYVYVAVVCQINSYVVYSESGEIEEVKTQYCNTSTECTVTIPCCPAPKNPIPSVCVSDCDGVGAETSFVFHTSNYNSVNNGTIAIIDTAGTKKTYKIKNDYGANASNQEFNAGGSRAAAAENLSQIIESSNGHNGTIHAYDSAGRRWNHGSKDFSNGKVVLKQVAVGSAGNTTITTAASFDNTTSTNATAFRCGFDSGGHPQVRISWAPVDVSDKVVLYSIYRRETSGGNFAEIGTVLEDRTSGNVWDSVTSRFYYNDDSLNVTTYCDDGISYDYAVVALNENAYSGNPNDDDWGDWVSDGSVDQGDKCSPGGTTVAVTLVNCPPTPCLEAVNEKICVGWVYSVDLTTLVDCLPKKADNSDLSVTFALVGGAGVAWLSPSLSGDNILTIDTSDVDFATRGAGPHLAARWRFTINDSACSGSYTADVNLTLEDCGCPCPDDEKDYTICDVNFDNAQYLGNDSSIAAIAGKLVNNWAQVPFCVGREGGQNLRKGQPYVVSKGKIDCD